MKKGGVIFVLTYLLLILFPALLIACFNLRFSMLVFFVLGIVWGYVSFLVAALVTFFVEEEPF